MPVEDVAQAIYCAEPDAVSRCIKLCSDVSVSGIGVRVGAYIQAIAFFGLTLLSPYEAGAESVWVGLSVSYSMLVTGFIMLYQGFITSQHCIVIFLLSMLPYLGTLAAMNSLTAYRGLGKRGMRVLQIGLLVKNFLTAFMWYLCLHAFYIGQPPAFFHLKFRQPACFSSTALVVFFVPVRPTDENKLLTNSLVIFYTLIWALLVVFGSFWTFRAPTFLARQRKELEEEGPVEDSNYTATGSRREVVNGLRTTAARKKLLEKDPEAYKLDDSDEADYLMYHSLPKSSLAPESGPPKIRRGDLAASAAPTTGAYGAFSPDPEDVATDISHGEEPKPAPTAWHPKTVKKAHQYFIWPVVAIFLTLNIVTTELQVDLNEVFEGEMEWDFPGTLSVLLALPTVWGVAKALYRIKTGRRPSPAERMQENFFALGTMAGRAEQAALEKDRRKRERNGGVSTPADAYSSADSSDGSAASISDGSYDAERGRMTGEHSVGKRRRSRKL